MKLNRKTLVTHKRFQYGFVLCLGVFGGLLGLMNSWLQLYIEQQGPANARLTYFMIIGCVILLVCTPIALAALLFTNRVSGPLQRLKKHMELAADGEIPSNFKFRDKDFFRDLEAPYNQILEKLRNSAPK